MTKDSYATSDLLKESMEIIAHQYGFMLHMFKFGQGFFSQS